MSDEHKYTLDGVQMQASVTERIAQHITGNEFDAKSQSEGLFSLCQQIRANPDGRWTAKQRATFETYKGFITPEDIATAWEENRQRGTQMHKTIELLLKGAISPRVPEAQLKEIAHFKHFYNWFSRDHEVVASEAIIIMPEISTGGTIDCVWRPKHREHPNDIILVDWKKMPPALMQPTKPRVKFFPLPNCKRTEQEVQLNMYAHMVESMTTYRVVRMMVVYLDPNFDTWDIANVPRYAETADYVASLRSACEQPLVQMADSAKILRGRPTDALDTKMRK